MSIAFIWLFAILSVSCNAAERGGAAVANSHNAPSHSAAKVSTSVTSPKTPMLVLTCSSGVPGSDGRANKPIDVFVGPLMITNGLAVTRESGGFLQTLTGKSGQENSRQSPHRKGTSKAKKCRRLRAP